MSIIHWKGDLVDVFDTAGDWLGDAGSSTVPDPVRFNAGGFGDAVSEASVERTSGATLTTLVSFIGADGEYPVGALFADAAGNLIGTTSGEGGAYEYGTVFEIAKTKHGYASVPTTLVNFTGTNGSYPGDALIANAAGDLLGTADGGANDDGTVFEIATTKHGYASATDVVSFTGADGANPGGSLITDAAGDLFGTTAGGGANNNGTVFEIAKTKHGYASAPTTLVSFPPPVGQYPDGPDSSLLFDAAGDIIGTTPFGGAYNDGMVFEIAKTKHGYAGALTQIASFSGDDGLDPSSLIADAAGNLFGTTYEGGKYNDGTVFEIVKTKNGYASAPTTLANFTGVDGPHAQGAHPNAGLIIDAAGDLFGTTSAGGAETDGVVFEIKKTQSGYAGVPTTLVSFTGANGETPKGALIADAEGDLFGTTAVGGTGGGDFGYGTVFEITHSGFVTQQPADGAAVVVQPAPPAAAITHSSPLVATFVQAMAATSGRGETAGPVNGRTTLDSHQQLLAIPRVAVA